MRPTRPTISFGAAAVAALCVCSATWAAHDRAIYQALREVDRAQSQIARTQIVLQRQFERSADYQEALSAARQAQIDLNQSRASVLARVRQTDRYKLGQLQISRLADELDKLKAQPHPDLSQVTQLAADLLKQRSALSKMENELLAGDDTIRQARYAVIDAQAKIAALKQDFVQSIQNTAQWRAARKQLDQARSQLASIR